jgi:hypothetical protein
MKPKKKFFITVVILLILVNVYCFVLPYFKSSEKDLEKFSFEVALYANDLVTSFVVNEEKSSELYAGKIIKVTGFVKEVSFLNNRNTVILYSKNKDYGIICDVHKSQIEKIKTLKNNQKVSIKGICKGFLKDVILLNCYIDVTTNE